MKRLFFVVVWCFVLSFSSPLFSQTTDEESSPKVERSEAEQREQRVVDRFWSLLEKTPRRGTSLDRVYGFYVDTGRLDELSERCQKLTKEKPKDGKTWLLNGLILSRRSDDTATVEALKNATEFDVNDPLAPFYLGEAYIAQGQLRDAADSLELSLQRSLDVVQKVDAKKDDGVKAGSAKDILATLQTLGRVYERFGDQEKSAQVWNKLEELFPGDKEILVRIAETLEEEGKFDEAFKRYQRLADMSKANKFARVQYVLAASDIKIRLGDKQGAIDDFEKLLEELSGESWLAQSIRDRVERIFVRQADYAGLAGYYQKRLQKHPNELETVRRLAVALVRLSRTEEAAKLLSDALEKAPSNIPLRLALIDLLVADKKFDEVDKQYAKINEQEPNNPDFVSQWGLAVMEDTTVDETQRKTAATKIWNRLVVAKPNDPSTVVMIAELMNQAKIFDEAEKLYKKAIELRPVDSTYKEYLGYFYHHQDRKDEAVKTLWQIARGDRRTAANLSQLGGIFKSLGYADEAIAAMQAAVELAPDDFELRMQFGDLLFSNEKNDEAEKEFLAAEKLVPAISEESGRFIQAFTKLLQSTLRLNDASESLQKELQAESPGNQNDQGERPETKAAKYWRRAVYETALGRMSTATDAIESAMQLAPKFNVLLEAAANIYDKGNDQVKAAEIYEKLAASDPQRRVDYLKRLANIQRELGEMDQAIETARLVMATGSGNAANSRFYADMLLGIGRKKDGIEALRRAVRLDPTDTTTLSALAEVLFDSGQNDVALADEALEILWRIFDRTEDLSGKIALVGRMSNYYQQAQRFDQLIERLRKNSSDPASRRETAYCLAQAYVSVSDYETARQTLEMLLLGGAEDGENKVSRTSSDDTLLLSQLSNISELQGDVSTAIRYQEMLCDQLQSGPQAGRENERLLSLYQQEGDKDKAINHLLNYFVAKGKLHEQVKAIDDLLTRSDYASAEKILNQIEPKNPGNWELLYRRLETGYWLGKLDEAEKTAQELIDLKTPRDEESAKIQYEKSKVKPIEQPGNQQGASGRYSRYSGGRSPWGFGEHGFYNHYYGGMGGKLRESWQKTATPLIMTLFREKLQLERYYYHQSSASNTEPAKPQFEPENFGDARFAAEIWLLKIAFQRDLNEFREKNPAEEGKPEIAATESTGFKPERFEKAIDDLRDSLSVKAKEDTQGRIQGETQTLLDRLRLEYFFQTFYQQTIQQNQSSFPECNYAKLLFTLQDDKNVKDPAETKTPPNSFSGDEATRTLCSNIEQELGMKGETEWLSAAYLSVLNQLCSEIGLKLLDQYDPAKEFDAAAAKLSAEDRKKFSDEQISEARQYFLDRLATLRKERAEKSANSLSLDQKFDWIFQCWKEAIDSVATNFNSQGFHQVVSSAPQVSKILKHCKESPSVEKLRNLIQKATDENSAVAVMIARTLISSSDFQEQPQNFFDLLKQTFPVFGQELEKKQELADKDEKEKIEHLIKLFVALARNSKTEPDEPRFEAFKAAVERYKQAVLRFRDEVQKTKTSPTMRAASWQHLLLPQQFGDFFQSQFSRRVAQVQKILAPNQDNLVQYHHVHGVAIPVYRSVSATSTTLADETEKDKSKKDEDETPKTKLSQKQLELIVEVDKEYYRMLDYYFELTNELDGLQNEKSSGSAPAVLKKRLPSLTSYRSYFEHNQTLYRYNLNSMLQGGQGNAVVVVANQPDSFLIGVNNFMQFLDDRLKTVETEDGVDAALIRTDHAKRFERYLDEKAQTASEAGKKRIEITKSFFDSQSQVGILARTNQHNDEIDIDKTIAELEKEKTEAAQKGETFDSAKTMVLAILYKQKGDLFKSVECLDGLKLTASGDIRYREQFVLKSFPAQADNADFKKRAETAVQRLSGYQLKGDELKDMRQVYRLLGKNDEADRLRDRMLVVSTDLNTQAELLNELGNDNNKEKAAQYALKVFRSPAVRAAASGRQQNYAWHVRNQALDVLKNAGKLGEIVEQIETQWKSAPGSLDIMTALADIYQKAGRTEDAKKIAVEMADRIPDDAQKMQNYANLLQNIGMKDESADWMQKSIAKNPEQVLSNFWQYENSFRESKQTKKLIEILKKIKPQRLANQFGQFAYRMSEWSRNEETKAAAKDLLDYIWNMDGITGNELWRSRNEFVRQLSHSGPNVDFYPMFHEVIFKTLTPTEENKNESLNNSPMSVSAWGGSQVYSVSVTFFNLAEKKDENKNEQDKSSLQELKKEFQKLLSENFADEKTQKDQEQRYRLVRMLLAMNEIRLKNATQAVEIIESLEMTKPVSRTNPFSNQEFVVMGLELSKLDDPKAVKTAIKLFENEIRGNPDSHVQQVILVPLYKLYLKTNRAEQGRKLALDKLRESFRFMRLAGSNHYYQVGNRHYDIWELAETTVSLSRALLEADFAFDLMLVYRQDYDGQAWVSIARKNYDHKFRELDKISKELDGKISEKDFVQHLEQMIPGAFISATNESTNEPIEKPSTEQTGAKPDLSDEELKAKLPLILGPYIDSVKTEKGFNSKTTVSAVELISMLNEIKGQKNIVTEKNSSWDGSLAGIRLTDALKKIAQENPERYSTLKQTIQKLESLAPDDPTVLIALTGCRLIDCDETACKVLLRRCADWVKANDSSGKLTEQLCLGFWAVLKLVSNNEQLLDDPEVAADCRTIFPVVGKLVGFLSTKKQTEDSQDSSKRIYAFLLDLKRYAPDTLLSDFRVEFDANILEKVLLPEPGRLTRNLETQRIRVAKQLSDSLVVNDGKAVMKAFEKIFQSGWPLKEESGSQLSRVDSMYLLGVLEQVLKSAKQAKSNPNPIFESLLKIVLPADAIKLPFLGDYADLGGENGYYRTPAADLVDWTVAANRVDELKKQLDEKRKQGNAARDETAIRLDAVEFILALKTEDEKTIEKFKKTFLEGIEKNNALKERVALIAAMPCVKDSEFADLDENQYKRLIDLIDAALEKGDKDNRNRRYVYYIIRSLYDRFSKDAELSTKIRWLVRYRKITDPGKMDGFRFTMEQRLYEEGIKAIADAKTSDAVEILRYFAGCPNDQFRYRNLGDYLDRLQAKLETLPESERKELLADFDLTKVARQSKVKREKGNPAAFAAKDFGLPPLPTGKVVYQNDFEMQTGPEWSVDRRDTIPKIEQTFLGEFHSERLRFNLKNLPEHRFVRIRFDLLMLGGLDGLVGVESEFGVDVWEMIIDGKTRPIVSTFSNYRKDSYHQKQSFPDDYPLEFGVEPNWYGKVLSGEIWDDNMEKGYYYGRENAVLENKFGYEKDAAYAIDLIVPHNSKELELEFLTKFQDGPYGGNAINLTFGESWGLDNFSVELIDKSIEPDESALQNCFAALIGSDPSKAAAARWRLVAAEDKSVDYIAKWFAATENEAQVQEIRKTGNFDLFRIHRVLELIGTTKAESLINELRP